MYMTAVPTLEMSKLLLRKLEMDDAPRLYETLSDPENMKYRFRSPMQQLAEAEAFIRESEDTFLQDKAIRWAIIDKATGLLIGTFLWHFPKGKADSDIGYAIDRGWWDRGYIAEIIDYLCTRFLPQFGIRTLTARVHYENIASMKILEDNGFKRRGQYNEYFIYQRFWLPA